MLWVNPTNILLVRKCCYSSDKRHVKQKSSPGAINYNINLSIIGKDSY